MRYRSLVYLNNVTAISFTFAITFHIKFNKIHHSDFQKHYGFTITNKFNLIRIFHCMRTKLRERNVKTKLQSVNCRELAT